MAVGTEVRRRITKRILVTVSIMSFSRYGLTIDEIHHEVMRIVGERFARRTTRRDIEAMQEIGIAEVAENKPTDHRLTKRFRLRKSRQAIALASLGATLEGNE